MSAALATMARILALAADRNVDVNEFLAAIAAEPGLADEIVRVANSPRYGMQGKLTRLDRVALILGVRPVAEIAAGALLARRAAPEAEDPQRRSIQRARDAREAPVQKTQSQYKTHSRPTGERPA
jgi:HD-like signal output (HDOD) protein